MTLAKAVSEEQKVEKPDCGRQMKEVMGGVGGQSPPAKSEKEKGLLGEKGHRHVSIFKVPGHNLRIKGKTQ